TAPIGGRPSGQRKSGRWTRPSPGSPITVPCASHSSTVMLGRSARSGCGGASAGGDGSVGGGASVPGGGGAGGSRGAGGSGGGDEGQAVGARDRARSAVRGTAG